MTAVQDGDVFSNGSSMEHVNPTYNDSGVFQKFNNSIRGIILDNVDDIFRFNNQSAFYNDSEFAQPRRVPWLRNVGTGIFIPTVGAGCCLDGLILWVLGSSKDRVPVDAIQMNLAASDLINGFLGIPVIVAARLINEGGISIEWKVRNLFTLVILFNVTFENLTTMLITGLRAKQVQNLLDKTN